MLKKQASATQWDIYDTITSHTATATTRRYLRVNHTEATKRELWNLKDRHTQKRIYRLLLFCKTLPMRVQNIPYQCPTCDRTAETRTHHLLLDCDATLATRSKCQALQPSISADSDIQLYSVLHSQAKINYRDILTLIKKYQFDLIKWFFCNLMCFFSEDTYNIIGFNMNHSMHYSTILIMKLSIADSM